MTNNQHIWEPTPYWEVTRREFLECLVEKITPEAGGVPPHGSLHFYLTQHLVQHCSPALSVPAHHTLFETLLVIWPVPALFV